MVIFLVVFSQLFSQTKRGSEALYQKNKNKDRDVTRHGAAWIMARG